jgi:hypothetical protein
MSKAALVALVLLPITTTEASAQAQLLPFVARSFIGGVVRGAGTALGSAAMGAILNSNPADARTTPQHNPTLEPEYNNLPTETDSEEDDQPSESGYADVASAVDYSAQRDCHIEYQTEYLGQEYSHSEVVGVFRTPYGVTVQHRHVYRNHWRNTPVEVCDD